MLKEQAYRTIRDAIVSGELAPGERLRAAELEARFGISRAPVRDALARLTEESLVETVPNAYTRVALIEDASVLDDLEAELFFFKFAFESFAQRVWADHAVELTQRHKQIQSAQTPLAVFQRVVDYWAEVACLGGNVVLAECIAEGAPIVARVARLTTNAGATATGIGWFSDVHTNVAKGDIPAATEAFNRSVAQLTEFIAETLRNRGSAASAASS